MASSVTNLKRHLKRRGKLFFNAFWVILKSLFVSPNSKLVNKKLGTKTVLKSSYINLLKPPSSEVVLKSCSNIDTLAPFNYNKTIFIVFHQYFISYLIVWLCKNGVELSTIKYREPDIKYPERINVRYIRELMDSSDLYETYVYKPVLTTKILMDKLNGGGNIFMAADLGPGNHFVKATFGEGHIMTPQGIYALSKETGATIVPIWLSLKKLFPRPVLEIQKGEPFNIEKDVEEEQYKIDSAMQWFYERTIKEPYLLTRLLKGRHLKRKGS